MLYLTLTERLALMRTPFAEVELQNLDGASAPTVLPDPFTSSPSRELIVVRDLVREKKLYPENFCGRAGAAGLSLAAPFAAGQALARAARGYGKRQCHEQRPARQSLAIRQHIS